MNFVSPTIKKTNKTNKKTPNTHLYRNLFWKTVNKIFPSIAVLVIRKLPLFADIQFPKYRAFFCLVQAKTEEWKLSKPLHFTFFMKHKDPMFCNTVLILNMVLA